MEYKYKSIFANSITKVTNPELDKYISLAGLDSLKPLMPKDIDLNKNIDLIGAALNAAVIGRANLNGDSVSNEVGIVLAESFKFKFVDSQHDRNRVIGVICNTGLSEFGSNIIIKPEEALASKKPINISLALLLYRLVLPENYIKLVEASADPTSADFGRLSASWELLFNDYDIAIGDKNIAEATVISEESKKKDLEKYLQANLGRYSCQSNLLKI